MGKSAKPPVALIAGPTASGKSALALALAERRNAVVINADSAQVYRDLPVLSAAPTAEDLSRAEHRLYGFRDAAEACSAAEWAALAAREVADAHSKALLPILVGGTGLYFRTLLDGIAPVPPIDAQIRRRVRGRSADENRAELERADPGAAARLDKSDSSRIARALEVKLSTGKALAQWQARREGGIAKDVDLMPLILLPPRPWLYARCDARFAAMIGQGAVEEVERLAKRGLDPALPAMRAIGVREIRAFLAGDIDPDEMIRRGQQATRNYAKRQYTWFAHQPPADWPRFRAALEPGNMADALAHFPASA